MRTQDSNSRWVEGRGEWLDEHVALEPSSTIHRPRTPVCNRAFVSLLHGSGEDFFVYALVLARRLHRHSPAADRVLLLCPGGFRDSPDHLRLLTRTGWTHLVGVEAIDAPEWDRTRNKRHRFVFTKLRAVELPYKRVLLLDLDILPRLGVDLTSLFQVRAPGGKYHGKYVGPNFPPRHGELIPAQALSQWWCPNAGVLRLDPPASTQERREIIEDVVATLLGSGDGAGMDLFPTYLPEQYFLARRLDNWHHISEEYNQEVSLGLTDDDDSSYSAKAIEKTKVWHFSGKTGLQPWMFLNVGGERVEEWIRQHYGHEYHISLVAVAFDEWCGALEELQDELRGCEFEELLDFLVNSLSYQGTEAHKNCDAHRMRFRAAEAAAVNADLHGSRTCPWEETGVSYMFEDYVVYYRSRMSLGPVGDDEAFQLARRAWFYSYPVEGAGGFDASYGWEAGEVLP